MLTEHDAYLSQIEAVGYVPELQPTEHQRWIERQRQNEAWTKSSAEAESQSNLIDLFGKQTLLYGVTAISYVGDSDGSMRRLEKPPREGQLHVPQRDGVGLRLVRAGLPSARVSRREAARVRALIREYLASLRERGELDAMLPDLLSELGYLVFSRPSRGTRQLGVDVAAVGPQGDDRVYLFSIKSGDLTRNEWGGASDQALRPSLDEILDAYIPHQLPPEHSGKLIVICPCFGGEVREAAREVFNGYMEQRTTARVSFEVWNGDRLARHLEEGMLGERVMSGASRSHLRKAIATSDEADVSFGHFGKYLDAAVECAPDASDVRRLSAARQICVSLWMLFVWSREAGNLESAYLSSELALLRVWEMARDVLARNDRSSEPVGSVLSELLDLHFRVWDELIGRKVLPHAGSRDALSAAVRTASPLDVNLRLFDVVGRVALRGLWQLWIDGLGGDFASSRNTVLEGSADWIADRLLAMVAANGALLSPVSDGQVVDIALAFSFLAAHGHHLGDLRAWIEQLVNRADFSYRTGGRYPCMFTDYVDLASHPKDTDGYFLEATCGSVLLPTLAFWSSALDATRALEKLAALADGPLKQCTMQFWLPWTDSESRLWRTADGHGAALLDLPMVGDSRKLLDYVLRECGPACPFEELSAIKQGFEPLVLVACRHHRLPLPPQVFFKALSALRLPPQPQFSVSTFPFGKKWLLSTAAHICERRNTVSPVGIDPTAVFEQH